MKPYWVTATYSVEAESEEEAHRAWNQNKATLEGVDVDIRDPLTPLQREIINTLRDRGADFTARCAEDNWGAGREARLDTRNGAGRGLVRKFRKANAEALTMPREVQP